ncbi:WD40/YVTN/BNR-like repeat-containing protein [Legionella maioricensis]|uniref:NHL repeat protein n=1 Tax=Legionella maioricensis TaxID=2896528 RepID=A0A9X2D288_9GAMM|nr:hypothetical protein [Legionella maioricensis]MCL9685136.1 hypothetical protein [Legionella maioricensis]MCL9688351.1 hypothetical protein [Legionella maioricensis]
MKNTTLARKLFCFITALFVAAFAKAGSPLFTLTPLTPKAIQVSVLGTASVQYRVENQSSKSHTVVMTPIPGITQITNNGNCPNPFVLNAKQACTLTLAVNGNSLAGNVQRGPIVCQQTTDGSRGLCYQPSAINSLNITLSAPVQYLYAGAVNGNVYYSLNNGSTWTATPQSPGAGSPVNSIFATNTTLYAGCQNGNVYYSFNQGGSWNQTSSPDGSTVNTVFATSDTLYAGTANGNVMYSTNWGATWNATGTKPDGSAVNSIFVVSAQMLYAGTANGNVVYSTNGGATWNTTVAKPDTSAVTSVFVTSTALYIGTADEYVYTNTSLTGSNAWTTFAQSVYSLYVNSTGNVIAAGTQGGYVFSLINGNELGFVTYSSINSVFLLIA